MTVDMEFLDACRNLADNIKFVNEYFAKEYSIKEAIGYELNALLKKKQEAIAEIELMKEQAKIVKAKTEDIEKEARENVKKIEDRAKMRLIDVENEKVRMETEIQKLKEEKYNLVRV